MSISVPEGVTCHSLKRYTTEIYVLVLFRRFLLIVETWTVLSSQKDRYAVSVDLGEAFSPYLHVEEIWLLTLLVLESVANVVEER